MKSCFTSLERTVESRPELSLNYSSIENYGNTEEFLQQGKNKEASPPFWCVILKLFYFLLRDFPVENSNFMQLNYITEL